jgi:sirohydrochlorin ferrochelatase
MYEFARLRQQALEGVSIEVAFLAMARPLLEELLVRVAGQSFRRVVVQPHLLFHGELVESVEKQVAKMAAKHGETEWIVTKPLAEAVGIVTLATAMLEKVILERIAEAGIHVVAKRGDD